MKITFILPHAGLAGGTRVCAIYAAALKKKGHEITVFSQPRKIPGGIKARMKKMLGESFAGQPVHDPSHFDGVDVKHVVLSTPRAVTNADLPDADVVVATWWETAEWLHALSPSKGAKVYFIQHDERFPKMPIPRVEASWKLPLYRITIAQWLVDLGRHYYGVDQIELVPNGVDTTQFTGALRGKQKTPVVGMMYSASSFKGCDISIEAFNNAARNVAGLEMVAFGQEKPRDDLPLPKNSRFIQRPPQSEIKNIYAGCDAWLFGSRTEGFGLPILEAMACRTPVIGTPVGAAPELIREGGGVLVKPQDPIDMARSIERLCRMPGDQWQAMSELAYQTALNHTWEKSCEAFERALLTAAELQSSPASSG